MLMTINDMSEKEFNEYYNSLCEIVSEILPYYDVDKTKTYAVYIWNKADNLENIIIRDNKIILEGVDIFPTYYDEDYHYWTQTLNMNEIEYLKIEPMKEVE